MISCLLFIGTCSLNAVPSGWSGYPQISTSIEVAPELEGPVRPSVSRIVTDPIHGSTLGSHPNYC